MSGYVERMICNNEALSSLDDDLTKFYKLDIEKTGVPEQQKKFQINWLKDIRGKCKDEQCLVISYKLRIQELRNAVASNSSREKIIYEARHLYTHDQKEKSKELYELAASQGNAYAHYVLVAYFDLPEDVYAMHFLKALELGYRDALDFALDEVFFRASDLYKSNPKKALNLYNLAKKFDPTITLYEETEIISTINKCVETADFNPREFIDRHKLDGNMGNPWDLAKQASNSDRFGKPDPKLILSLVCRGGFVPIELIHAVNDAHAAWVQGRVMKFDRCQYAQSNLTTIGC